MDYSLLLAALPIVAGTAYGGVRIIANQQVQPIDQKLDLHVLEDELIHDHMKASLARMEAMLDRLVEKL